MGRRQGPQELYSGVGASLMGRPLSTFADARGRVCTACGYYFSWAEFARENRFNTRRSRCRKCRLKLEPDGRSKRQRSLATRISLYKISRSALRNLWVRQQRKCAICKRAVHLTSKDRSKVANVDHDHKTGLIRGLLCDKCNHGLGNFQDRPEFMRAAIRYLEPIQCPL